MVSEETCWQPGSGKVYSLHLSLAWLVADGVSKDFVAGVALEPPSVQVDEALLEQYNKEMEDAANAPLPDEDDPDL